MSGRTHTTAAVLIPPESAWPAIQAIRRQHDRQFRRWMPHITLLYPFRPRRQFAELGEAFRSALADLPPFELALANVRSFGHPSGSFTVWLAPEPAEAVVRLHETLWRVVPDCDDVRRHGGGFTPHLSVGQAPDEQAESALRSAVEARWKPIRFTCAEVSLVYRNDPPDDVFRVGLAVPLGGSSRPGPDPGKAQDP